MIKIKKEGKGRARREEKKRWNEEMKKGNDAEEAERGRGRVREKDY